MSDSHFSLSLQLEAFERISRIFSVTVDSNPEVASVSACCMWNTEHWIQQEMSLSVGVP